MFFPILDNKKESENMCYMLHIWEICMWNNVDYTHWWASKISLGGDLFQNFIGGQNLHKPGGSKFLRSFLKINMARKKFPIFSKKVVAGKIFPILRRAAKKALGLKQLAKKCLGLKFFASREAKKFTTWGAYPPHAHVWLHIYIFTTKSQNYSVLLSVPNTLSMITKKWGNAGDNG